MAVCFSEIWLLIGIVLVVQLPVTRGQLCAHEWTFHALTGSCMSLIKRHHSYLDARYYCQLKSQSIMKKDGHLVFILDKDTDEFVKGLLDEQQVDRALIGLNDRARTGHYVWGYSSPIAANYTGWADNSHTPDIDKPAVIMTKYGWRDYAMESRAYFVCQVSADFPTPKMVCPVAEVGHQSPDITCATDIHQSFSITGVRFMRTTTVVASCNANNCRPGQGYEQLVDVGEPLQTGRSASRALKLRNVTESHATDWTCSVEFNNSGYWVASQPCSLHFYNPAKIISFRIASRHSNTIIIARENITFSCEASGNPMPQLIVQRQDGPTLTNSSSGNFTYQKTATCSDTGIYVCLARNIVQGQHHQFSQEVYLQVRCAPEHCSGTSSFSFPAAIGAPSASIKLCVRAYPAPTLFILYKGNTTINMLKADKFQAYFHFTNEEKGLGEITVIISPFTQEDIGDYILYSECRMLGVLRLHSFLTFSLFARGK